MRRLGGSIAPIDFDKCPVEQINFPKILVAAMDFWQFFIEIRAKKKSYTDALQFQKKPLDLLWEYRDHSKTYR